MDLRRSEKAHAQSVFHGKSRSDIYTRIQHKKKKKKKDINPSSKPNEKFENTQIEKALTPNSQAPKLPLPESVLRQHLLLPSTSSRLPLDGAPEEQTGALHRLQQMAEIPPVSRVTVVLDIATLGRVRQTVLEAHLAHDSRLGRLAVEDAVRAVQLLAAALGGPRGRHERVHLALHDARDGGARVEAACHGAAGGFDRCDGGGGGARYHDVDGVLEGAAAACGGLGLGGGVGGGVGVGGAAEQLHAFFGLVDAAGLGELADRDRAGWVDAALIDPGLDTV